ALAVVVGRRGLSQALDSLVLDPDQGVLVGLGAADGDAELERRLEVERLMGESHGSSAARGASPAPAPGSLPRSAPGRSPGARWRAWPRRSRTGPPPRRGLRCGARCR